MIQGKEFLIGRGRFTWPNCERVSDRYGCVMLAKEAMIVHPEHIGKVCTLKTIILESRQSHHIGDLFHGIFPRKPNIGDKFALGTGKLFTETNEGQLYVGLEPEDGRETQWLDMRALYDNHDQTVELILEVL